MPEANKPPSGAMRIGCPQCKAVIQVRAESAGQITACPRCQTRIKIPGGPAKPAAQPKIVIRPASPDDEPISLPAEMEESTRKPPSEEPAPPPPDPGAPAEPSKREGTGTKLSYLALGMWAASAAVMVISGLILWSSIARWGIKSNLNSSLHLHDSNQSANVAQACQSTLSWNASHHPTRELWAKVLADSGALEQAEEQYQNLLTAGYRKPSVYAGLGAIYLKKADREKEASKIDGLIAKAQGFYGQASSIPEGEIGAGLCLLLAAVKKNDSARVKDARGKLEAAAKTAGDKTSREGLMDLYAGLGAAIALCGDDPVQASEYCNRAAQFNPNWVLPLGNLLLLRAKNLAEKPPLGDEYKKRNGEIKELLNGYIERTNNRLIFGDLVPPLNEFTAACIVAFLQNQDYEPVSMYAQRLLQNSKDLLATRMALAESWRRAFDPSEKKIRDQVNRTALPWMQDLLNVPEVSKNGPLRSITHNNVAAYKEYMCFAIESDPNKYVEAIGELKRAVEADPDNYAAHRNMAVLLKRNAISEKTPDGKKQWNEQCDAEFKKAEAIVLKTTEDWIKADYPKLKDYCQRP